MAQKNDEMTGFAIALSFAGAVIGLMAAFVFALLAFLSLVVTVLCVFAWNEPIMVFGLPLTPKEARRFVRNGLVGAVVVPSFIVFVALLFGLHVNPDFWIYALIGGYAAGSVLPEIQRAEQEKALSAVPQQLPPPVASSPAPQCQLASDPTSSFRFATWDDEEARS